jgi:hypothetical protein
MAIAPCVAMTNGDRAHGAQVQAALGFDLSSWICAEDVRCYKPHARRGPATHDVKDLAELVALVGG